MSPSFSRRRDGSIDVVLTTVEADALRRLAQDLVAAIDTPDDGFRRLFPPAYPDDEAAQEQFRSLTRDELITGKKDAARAVVDVIDGGARKRDRWRAVLDPPTASALLGLVNDARLILGTRMDVTEEMEPHPLSDDDPRAPTYNLYLYLGGLQELLVDAMLPGVLVPEEGEP